MVSMFTLSLGLFLGMVVCLELGLRVGRRALVRNAAAHRGLGPLAAAIFALLGLLLGFAFAGAMSRYQDRRALVIQEANAIRSAYLRIDLMPADQHQMRRLFHEYLDARIQVYQDIPERVRDQWLAKAGALQRRIWADAVAAHGIDTTNTTALVVLPALNQMIDATTARTLLLRSHMPTLILVLVCLVSLLSGLVAGYAMSIRRRPSILHMVCYAGCVSLTLFAVLDLDNPSEGFIHVTRAEELLEDLRHSIRE